MSTFKLNVLSLFVLVFSLTSIAHANDIVCDPIEDLPQLEMSKSMLPPGAVDITYPMSSYVRYIVGAPMTIGATADTNSLVNLSVYVNGTMVIGGATGTITSSYTPETTGLYTLLAQATYADGSTSAQTMTFRVIQALQTPTGTGYIQLIRP